MYRIKDLQFNCRYYADGHIVKNKQEACDIIIDYHSIGCDMSQEQKLFNEGKFDKCWDLLSDFEWQLEKV